MRLKAVGIAAALGAPAGFLAVRRILYGRRDRIDVYLADGTFITFVDGSPEGERLLPLARQVLAAVQQTPSEWPIDE